MVDKKKKVKTKKKPLDSKTKHDEWVVDKLSEVVAILEEHQKIIERIKVRMGL
jgi:hypothetical protein|tara:strand:- start:656 stop:814 length:159 start_codon:yes stop_codon:yes gene_type:complete